MYPGATETWYDGIDADCAGDSDFDADRDGHDWDGATGGDDCDDGDASVHPGASETGGDGVDSDCDGEDGPIYIDSYTGGGYTVYKMPRRALPGGDAAAWYQEACESVGLRTVSCDPWGTTGGPYWGEHYDASDFNAVELPYSHYSCNVSSGIMSRTGWENIITYHNPYRDSRGVCEGGCGISGSDIYPICTDAP